MANLQVRNPGAIPQVNPRAQIDGAPSPFVRGENAVVSAIGDVSANMGAKLLQLASVAAAREGEAAGMAAGARSGAAYLQQQQALAAASARAVSGPLDREALHRAQLMQESGGNPDAVSPKGARGLMQIMPETAANPGFGLAPLADIDDPAANEAFGRAYMDKLLDRYQGDHVKALAAYNWGAGNADKWDGDMRRLPEETRNYITRIVGNAQAKAPSVPAPAKDEQRLSTVPLQLRKDGTVYGDAYDKAAMRAYGWRVEQGLASELAAAHEQYGEDPRGFEGAVAAIRQKYLSDGNLDDPDLREAFERNLTERLGAYRRDITGKLEARLRREESAAATGAIEARLSEMERQAYAVGGNPDGDGQIKGQMDRTLRIIDGAVREGAISPDEGARYKQALDQSTARARTQGVFDHLPTPEAKEQFALSLLEDWSQGKGALARLPLETVKAMSVTLANNARQQMNQRDSGMALEKLRIGRLIDDDIASMAATGQGVEALDAASVGAVLGLEGMARWQARRAEAADLFSAVNGMETQSAADIETRLAMLAPEPGQAGYEAREKVFETATKRAAQIARERNSDPAAAVQAAFPQLAEQAGLATPEDPASMQALVAARLDAQAALGIDEMLRNPLTTDEARRLAAMVSGSTDPAAQAKAMQDLMTETDRLYGPHGEAVVTQILQQRGIDRQMAEYGARFFGRLARGEAPPVQAARQGQVLQETASAEQAMQPSGRQAWPVAPYRAQQMLMQKPSLAQDYDRKYGPGAAARLLGRTGQAGRVEDGGIATYSDDGETWTPISGDGNGR